MNSDGSFERRTVYTAKGIGGFPTPGTTPNELTDPKKLFKLPSTGVVRTTSKEGQQTLTVDKKYGSGRPPLQDITLLSDKKADFLKSTVSVEKLPNGNISYDEALVCKMPAENAIESAGKARAEIKSLLPKRFQRNSKVIDAVSVAAGTPIQRFLFGPPYPRLFDLMGDEDAGLMVVRYTVSPEIAANLAQALPEATAAERKVIVDGIFASLGKSFNPAKQIGARTGMPMGDLSSGESSMMSMNMSTDPSTDTNQMTPLLFSVKFKGTIVKTNGLVDPSTGHVFWSLYPMGAATPDGKPIHLQLVIAPAAK